MNKKITGLEEQTLKLFRLFDEEHILLKAPEKYRQAYYEALLELTDVAKDKNAYAEYFNDLKMLFNLTEPVPIQNNFSLLNKAYFSLHAVYRK